MNIRFLGTGAANWPDSLHGTEEYRRFSSITVDDTLLIDPGKKSLSLPKISDITTCLILSRMCC